MKLADVTVTDFRCLENVTIAIDDLTVLLGPNNAGKSTLLRALEFFFHGADLSSQDVYANRNEAISVQATFRDIGPADRAVLGRYAQGEQVVLTRTWTAGEAKLTGTALRFESFDPIKRATGREPARLCKELRNAQPELGLPEATTKDAVEQAMLTWEMEHPDRCVPTPDEDASSLLGYSAVGKRRLEDRFRYVFVPGLRDASAEVIERKGTLLSRLLTAVAEQRAQASDQLAQLQTETRERYEELINESHGPTLDELAERLEQRMQRYVPTAGIALRPLVSELELRPPVVELRGGESQNLTDLGRQGHGFQRTFIISVLEYLAESGVSEGGMEHPPTLMLAIEEPELYQHPPRARHFAQTLKALADPQGSVQVCYATHSPYFVAAEDFEQFRLFRTQPSRDDAPPVTTVASAEVTEVVRRLPENQQGQPQRVLARTLSETFREAFFSRAALLLEGPTDAAVFTAVARKVGQSLVAWGVVPVYVGKSAIPLAYAILRALAIPTFVVFDADEGATDQPACGTCGGGARTDRTSATRANRAILHSLGVEEEDFPSTGVHADWACFSQDLEAATPNLVETAAQVAERYGWRAKSPEAYAEAITQLPQESIPPELPAIVERVLALSEQGPHVWCPR